MKTLAENQFGTGARRRPLDLRDHKWEKVAMATNVAPFDWSKGCDIEENLRIILNNPLFKKTVKNQGTSFSCVGQAGSYYESTQDTIEKGEYIERSARDAYSQIYWSEGGGSTIRDVLSLLCKKGICRESLLKSYDKGNPPTEGFMRNRSDCTPECVVDAEKARGTSYAFIKNDIDSIAQAIKENNGVIFCVDGQDNGTWRSAFPKPPIKRIWGHALYACKAKKKNGRKYIGVINSWGEETGEKGIQWLGEEYMPWLYDIGTLYDNTKYNHEKEKSLIEKILELCQKIINKLK